MEPFLSRDAILTSDDLLKRPVKVPEWGGTVLVKRMTGAERDAYELAEYESSQDRPRANIRARLAAATLCDEGGRLLFSPADVAALGAKSGAALDRVFDAARELNKVTKADLDELEKNSETIPSGSSNTGSPAI